MPVTSDNLSRILKRINEKELRSFSLSNFVELAIDFLKKTISLRENQTINLVLLTHIKIDYKNINDHQHYVISEIAPNTYPYLSPNADEYIQNTALILQKLFFQTEVVQTDLESIISRFIKTELKLFSSRQTPYKNVAATKEINLLKRIFIAVQKLLNSQQLADLDINQSMTAEELRLCIWGNISQNDFNEKIVGLFAGKINKETGIDHTAPQTSEGSTNTQSFSIARFTRLFSCAHRQDNRKIHVAPNNIN